jgi:hypothetical protein
MELLQLPHRRTPHSTTFVFRLVEHYVLSDFFAYGYQNGFNDSLAQEFRKVLSVLREMTFLEGYFFSDDINFTRASSSTYFDADGILQTAVSNIRRIDYILDGSGLCGLLIEGERINKFIQGPLPSRI